MSIARTGDAGLGRLGQGQRVQRRHRVVRKKVVPWLFALPTLAINLVVILGPSISAGYYSLTEWSGVGAAEFVGLDNYRRLFTEDRSFHRAFLNNVIYLIIFLTLPMVMSLVAASLLAPIRRASMVYRIGLFIPYVLPSVITAFIWTSLMDPGRGLGSQLARIGIPWFDQPFLGRSSTALPSIAFIDNWHWWGFLMVLFLAGMQGIPADLSEAARIDGASRWQEFRDVTLPGIRPTIVFMILMTSIGAFLVFDYIWILTQGGPAGASEVLATLVFKAAFNNFEAGYAAAIGLVMSLLAGAIISVFVFLRRRGWEI